MNQNQNQIQNQNQDDSLASPSSQTSQYSAHAQADAQVDAHSVRARESQRAELRVDIEAFLANGGKVTSVAAEVRSDVPRKPQNNYGKGSL